MHRALSRSAVLLIIIAMIILGSFVAFYAIQNAGIGKSTCVQSASSNVDLTLVNDSTNSSTRLQGVQVNGVVKWECGSNSSPGYFIASEKVGKLSTPNNGTVFVGSIVGNYSLTLTYGGKSYALTFDSGAEQNVNVTFRLPSDRVTVIECVFGGAGSPCFNETNPSDPAIIASNTSSTNSTFLSPT